MTTRRGKPALAVAVVVTVISGFALALRGDRANSPRPQPPAGPTLATLTYLASLDPARFERRGTDYTNPHFSPLRLGRPLDQIDPVYDYDFDRLESVTRSLDGVDRQTVLAALFGQVTRGCRTNAERHLAVLKFLHKASNHNARIQPMRPDRLTVADPLILLELGEMRCGHVNRVAVDLFRAAGFDGRLVQVGFHLAAEVVYDGTWHYFDADIWGNGECVRNPDGTIPSVVELSRHPERLDSLTAYWEPNWQNSHRGGSGWHPSWYYFAAEAYAQSGVEPCYHLKSASPDEERASPHYGWENCDFLPDPDRTLWPDLPRRLFPGVPVIVRCNRSPAGSAGPAAVDLRWEPDPVAAGFWVFVGRRSRGWNYDSADALPDHLRHLKSSGRGWRPEDYEARFTRPPADVALLDVSDPQARVILPDEAGPVFVTVMGYDAHGRAVGRQIFPMSEELRLDP